MSKDSAQHQLKCLMKWTYRKKGFRLIELRWGSQKWAQRRSKKTLDRAPWWVMHLAGCLAASCRSNGSRGTKTSKSLRLPSVKWLRHTISKITANSSIFSQLRKWPAAEMYFQGHSTLWTTEPTTQLPSLEASLTESTLRTSQTSLKAKVPEPLPSSAKESKFNQISSTSTKFKFCVLSRQSLKSTITTPKRIW